MVHIHNGTFSHEKQILPFATTWMELEDIMLSEISQAEKDKYQMISLICAKLKEQSNSRLTNSKKGLAVTKGEGRWGGREEGRKGKKNMCV